MHGHQRSVGKQGMPLSTVAEEHRSVLYISWWWLVHPRADGWQSGGEGACLKKPALVGRYHRPDPQELVVPNNVGRADLW